MCPILNQQSINGQQRHIRQATLQLLQGTSKRLMGTSKNQFRWLFEVPCGTCLLREGLTINGLHYRRSCPFPQTPIPLRFFDVPCGTCLLG